MPADASLTPELIQAHSFTSGFRGYDQAEVRSFLNRVSAEVRSLRERAENLESAWRSAEERAARPPVLDEDTLMAAVGEETAAILRSARAAASEMRTKAADDAEKLVAEARERAARTAEEAGEAAAAEARAAEEQAGRIVSSARTEAAEVLEKARADAVAVRADAEKDKQLTIEGATSTRDRILDDLARRRRVATVQIEQLRAGRERLIESYAVVRRTLEEAQAELSRADAEARAAAEETGRRLRQGGDADPPDPWHAGDPAPQGGAARGDQALDLTEPAPAGAAAPAAAGQPEPDEPAGGEREEAAVETAGTAGTAEGAAGGAGAKVKTRKRAHLGRTRDEAAVVEEPPGSKVDELFARIRATRSGDADSAGEAVEAPAAEAPAEAPAEDAAAEAAEDDAPPQRALSDGDESLLQQRESVVVDLEITLTRRLKRALQDEQNDLLDRLRNLRQDPTVERLLPGEEDQVSRYADAARPLLAQALSAGAEFATRLIAASSGDAGGGPAVNGKNHAKRKDRNGTKDHAGGEWSAAQDAQAREAAGAVVGALRRRLEQAIAAHAGEDQAVLVESIGAAYREWKTQRVEQLAGDMLSAAFSKGTWEASPEGTLMRWIAEDTGGPCPDCDDDALAGGLPKGEAFPTGQNHPPAHPGCRCLLVPAPGL